MRGDNFVYKHMIGKSSNKVLNTIERGAVKKFAESIGDLHPIYSDRDYAKNSRYKNNIAPPTFPRVLDFGVIEGLILPKSGLIHGEQRYHYERPLLVGEDIYCYAKVVDSFEKAGANGTMYFLAIDNNGEDLQGNIIFTSTIVMIITEEVRKGMGI
nr:MaoC family dehydratase N-terminal domain-containing protein [Neobacillus niacini]